MKDDGDQTRILADLLTKSWRIPVRPLTPFKGEPPGNASAFSDTSPSDLVMVNSLSIWDRVAVVIGATSGIGRALAVGLANHGAHTIPSGRRKKEIDEIALEIEAIGRRSLRHPVDAGDRRSIDALRDAALAEFGRVDILINAAGCTFREPTLNIREEKWAQMIDINLTGVLRACQSFHGPLASSGRGRIVNIASLGSYRSFHQVAAYCAAKTAVLSLTRSLACEWAADGISVNAIAPGVFPTELNNILVRGTPRGEEMLMRTPMRRFGRPDELVGVTVMLASDAASFLTGHRRRRGLPRLRRKLLR